MMQGYFDPFTTWTSFDATMRAPYETRVAAVIQEQVHIERMLRESRAREQAALEREQAALARELEAVAREQAAREREEIAVRGMREAEEREKASRKRSSDTAWPFQSAWSGIRKLFRR
jgi:hypothetical protein